MRFLLLLIIIAGVVACFTRPDADAQWATVAGLIKEGKVDGGALAGRAGRYENFYVASRYVFSVDGRQEAECWGAFTRFLCTSPAAPAPGKTTT